MIIQRRKHRVPGLNTTSTADISFMLLIFFLVTTSMDVDKGLSRQLPPAEKQEVKKQVETNIAKKDLLAIKILADNKIMVNDKPAKVGVLSQEVVNLVRRAGKKHLVTLVTDRNADYNTYFQVQNELMKGFHKVRNITKPRIAESYANASIQTVNASTEAVNTSAEEAMDNEKGASK